MKYYELQIGILDLDFLNNLTEKTKIEWDEIDFEIYEGISGTDITNICIDGVYRQYIESLDFLTDKQKETLEEKIYINCIDSRIDNLEGFIEEENLEDYEKELSILA